MADRYFNADDNMDDISGQLALLFQQTQHTEKMVKASSEELEGYRIQLQERQKLTSFIKISAQGANPPPANMERVRRDLAVLDNKLKNRASELLYNRQRLINHQRKLFNQISVVQNAVVYKHLAQWKYDQQHSKAEVKVLNRIQEWVEVLTDIIWRLRNQLKGLHHTFTTQPNIVCSSSDIEELDRFGCCVDRALETLTLSTFVVEKQPPQVMKTNTRLTSTVRYLSGVKLGVEMIRPTVKVTILSESNARAIIQRHQELIQSSYYPPICSPTTTNGPQQQITPSQAQQSLAPVQMDFTNSNLNQTSNHDLYAQHQQVVHHPPTTQASSPTLELQQQPSSLIHHAQQQQAFLQHQHHHQQQQQLPMHQVQLQQPQYQIPQQQYVQQHHPQQPLFEQDIKNPNLTTTYHPLKIVNINEFDPSGEILNNSNRLEYQDGQLVCHFRNMQLKKIKRTEKKGTESVMDEKFVLLFHTQIRIAESYQDEIGAPTQSSWIKQGDLSYHIMAFSLPVVVIVHGNQEPHAWATVTWHNAFARPDELLYQVPNEVTWRELGQVLSDKFVSCAGKGLSEHNLNYLASKVCRSRYENDDVMVSWGQFSKDPLPDKSFTFWEWFHSILKLTREHLSDLWSADRIYGFIGKQGCVDLLLGAYGEPSPIGTFLLRYSETELGGITIAWVSPPCQQPHSSLQSSQSGDGEQLKRLSPTSLSSTSNVLNHLQPYNSRDLHTRSIADRIRDLADLVYLYPYIPKDEAFKKYYSPLNDSLPANNGYIKPMLIQTLVTNYRKNSSSNSMEFANASVTTTLFSHDSSPEGIYQDNSFTNSSHFATMYD